MNIEITIVQCLVKSASADAPELKKGVQSVGPLRALDFAPPGRHVHSDTNSASLGSILAMQQLCNIYSLTCPPLSIARNSFIQLSRLRRREENENAKTLKR